MTSTSSDRVVVREERTDATPLGVHDLRAGQWTRLGAPTVLGDPVTEATLGALADRTRAAGHAQGYAAGWAEGRRRADEAAAAAAAAHAETAGAELADLRRLRTSLEHALADATRRCDDALAESHAEMARAAVELGLAVAAAVLQREVAATADPGAEALQRALAEVPPTASATVRMNPADAAALGPAVLDDRPVTVVADASIASGGVVLETETTTVDATLESALARVRAALTGDDAR